MQNQNPSRWNEQSVDAFSALTLVNTFLSPRDITIQSRVSASWKEINDHADNWKQFGAENRQNFIEHVMELDPRLQRLVLDGANQYSVPFADEVQGLWNLVDEEKLNYILDMHETSFDRLPINSLFAKKQGLINEATPNTLTQLCVEKLANNDECIRMYHEGLFTKDSCEAFGFPNLIFFAKNEFASKFLRENLISLEKLKKIYDCLSIRYYLCSKDGYKAMIKEPSLADTFIEKYIDGNEPPYTDTIREHIEQINSNSEITNFI
jgi:hypothetical protein